jgi:2-octaprenyl-6-methoxyphenol hydroxylase
MDVAESVDIAVVGTGPVGLLGALAFARAGRRVCLVGPEPEGGEGRTAALLAPSVELLEELGLWPALAPHAAALRGMRIVDDSGSLFRPPPVEFTPRELGLDAFGWNIENARLTRILADAVASDRTIVWHRSLADGFATGHTAVLTQADGAEVEAKLVVAADGRRSRVREAAGIGVREHRYRQAALTAIFRHGRPHGQVSTEFHKRGGPMTLVPMPEGDRAGFRSSLVWVTEPHHAKRLAALEPSWLARAVEDACHRLLGEMELDGPRGTVPLSSMKARRFVGERLALAGEAAHVLPPIGAQGLNLGFSDIASLRRLLWEGGDPGTPALLARYDRERRADAGLRGLAVHGLNRALLSHSPLLDAARGIGLGLLGGIGPLRRAVMRAGLPASYRSR